MVRQNWKKVGQLRDFAILGAKGAPMVFYILITFFGCGIAPLRHDFSPSSNLGKFFRCGMDPLSGGHAAGNFPFYGGTQGAPEGPPGS